MSVSYLSQPVKSSAYVPPVDLGIFANVLQTKQQQFDLGAAKEQESINQMANLDVIRPQDREYLNNKINNLTSTINNFGGKDFSDPNVLNQIEGLGNDIYGDSKVINAVTSTKQVRKLLNGYDQYKTDPKLSSLYSSANEYIDSLKVNDWMNNKDVGKAYDGASAPTPFVPYKKNMIAALDKVKADYQDNVSVDGYYISKDGTTRITPERLTAIALQTLTPDEQAQVYRDGVYQYRSSSPEDIVKKSLSQYQEKVDETKSMKLYYESQAKAAGEDPNARRNYLILAAQKDSELASLTKDPQQVTKAVVDKATKDLNGLKGEVYQNDFISGMANLFSQNKTTRAVTANLGQIAVDRMAQAERHYDLDYAQKNTHFYDDLAEKYWEKGQKMIVDPQTGDITTIPLTSLGGKLMGTGLDTRNPDDIKVTPQSLKKASDDNKLAQNKEWNSFWSKYLTDHPELAIEEPSTDINTTGTQELLKGQKFLEGFNKEPGMQLEDLAAVESADVQKNLLSAGLNQDQIQTLVNLHRNFQSILEGKGNTVGDLPKDFVDAATNVAMLKEGERTIEGVTDRAVAQVLKNHGISQEGINLYLKYRKNPIDFTYSIPGSPMRGTGDVINLDPRIATIENHLQGIDIKKEIQKYFDPISLHNTFQTKTFSDEDRKDGTISTFIYNEANRLNKDAVKNLHEKDITPTSAGMMGDGTGRFYITADVTGVTGLPNITLPLSDAQAKTIGLQRDPLDNLNQSVNLLSKSGDIPVYVNNKLAVNVSIVKPDKTSVNSETYALAKFYEFDGKGNRIPDPKKPGEFLYTSIKIPNTEGSTASESFVKAQDILNKAGKNPLKSYDIEGFRQLLTDYNKNQQ